MAVRLSALSSGRLYPHEDSWYSFLLDNESSPGQECGWKHKVSEKCNDLTGNRTRDIPTCSLSLSLSLSLLLLLFLHSVHCLTQHSASEAGPVSVCRWKCGINFSEPFSHAARSRGLTGPFPPPFAEHGSSVPSLQNHATRLCTKQDDCGEADGM
jgi:hypothetical protein